MSNRYKGAVISATPPTTSGGPSGVASGAWTLEQQMQLQAASLWPSQPPPNYIEDVFSTYLYTADGSSTQTITNGIDLSGKGGLVWIKSRSNATGNVLVDTVRGSPNVIQSNNTNAQASWTNEFGSFSSTGFTVPYNTIYGETNFQTRTYTSWAFRKQPKFFDVQTFTYPSSGSITVPHNLASTPGCVMVKVTDGVDGWYVYHRMANNGTNPSNYILQLNTTGAQINNFASWITVGSTSITFPSGALNPGSNFVMYLFAHDAGGFGLTGTDNVISCGSFTTDGSGNFLVNLGYEPQWILAKQSSGSANNWCLFDNMRGMSNTNVARLIPNSSAAETDFAAPYCVPSATGFYSNSGGFFDASQTVVYIAIRRGPMAVPTVGTSVFVPTSTATAVSPGATATTNFPVDLSIYALRNLAGLNSIFFDKLRGTTSTSSVSLVSSDTTAEANSASNGIGIQSNTTVTENWTGGTGYNNILWNFRRAPSFFDEVCYTGTGVATTQTHNLAAVPELMIVKRRSAADDWAVYTAATGNGNVLFLNLTDAVINSFGMWNGTTPTASVFSIGTSSRTNSNAVTYVAYLFATCAGVSKVGTYTGNGTTQTIDCGFGAGGARFVLIKRTDSTGDWYVYDTARGMTVLTDPYLLLNTTAAEVATLGSVTTVSTGFALNSAITAAINVSAGTYIFLAIA